MTFFPLRVLPSSLRRPRKKTTFPRTSLPSLYFCRVRRLFWLPLPATRMAKATCSKNDLDTLKGQIFRLNTHVFTPHSSDTWITLRTHVKFRVYNYYFSVISRKRNTSELQLTEICTSFKKVNNPHFRFPHSLAGFSLVCTLYHLLADSKVEGYRKNRWMMQT